MIRRRSKASTSKQDVEWMHVKAENCAVLYKELHSDQAWYSLYTRPPALVKVAQ